MSFPFTPAADETVIVQGDNYVLTNLRLVYEKGKRMTAIIEVKSATLLDLRIMFSRKFEVLISNGYSIPVTDKAEGQRLVEQITLAHARAAGTR